MRGSQMTRGLTIRAELGRFSPDGRREGEIRARTLPKESGQRKTLSHCNKWKLSKRVASDLIHFRVVARSSIPRSHCIGSGTSGDRSKIFTTVRAALTTPQGESIMAFSPLHDTPLVLQREQQGHPSLSSRHGTQHSGPSRLLRTLRTFTGEPRASRKPWGIGK